MCVCVCVCVCVFVCVSVCVCVCGWAVERDRGARVRARASHSCQTRPATYAASQFCRFQNRALVSSSSVLTGRPDQQTVRVLRGSSLFLPYRRFSASHCLLLLFTSTLPESAAYLLTAHRSVQSRVCACSAVTTLLDPRCGLHRVQGRSLTHLLFQVCFFQS